MLTVVSPESIRAALDIPAATLAVEKGFEAYSTGRAVVPPVGYLDSRRSRGLPHQGRVHLWR